MVECAKIVEKLGLSNQPTYGVLHLSIVGISTELKRCTVIYLSNNSLISNKYQQQAYNAQSSPDDDIITSFRFTQWPSDDCQLHHV